MGRKRRKTLNLELCITSKCGWSNPLFCSVYVIYTSLRSQLSQLGIWIGWLFFSLFKTAFISRAHSEQIFATLDWEILLIVPILRCWFNVMAGWFGSSYRLHTGSRWDDEIKSDEAQLLRKYMSTLNHTIIKLDVVLLPMWMETCLFLCTYTMRYNLTESKWGKKSTQHFLFYIQSFQNLMPAQVSEAISPTPQHWLVPLSLSKLSVLQGQRCQGLPQEFIQFWPMEVKHQQNKSTICHKSFITLICGAPNGTEIYLLFTGLL